MFTDAQIQSMLAPQLAQNERIVARARGVEKPWYARIFARLGSLFWRNYLLVATDQRLFLIHHAGILGGKKVKQMDTLAWGEIERAHLGWGIFNKNFSVRAPARGYSKTICLGRFWMKQNFDGAQSIVQCWTQARQMLPAQSVPHTLPAPAYGR